MSLSSEREAIAALVSDEVGFPVTPYVPNRLNAPGGIVIPGSPYLEDGRTFGTSGVYKFTARYEIVFAFAGMVNEVSTPALDRALESALTGLANTGHGIENVSEVFTIPLNGQNYLAATITITKQIEI